MSLVQATAFQFRAKSILPALIAAALLVPTLFPSYALAFRLLQVTTGAGTYTAGAAVAPAPGIVTVRWGIREVAWTVNANGAGDGLTFAQTRDAVLAALGTWENVQPADLNLRMPNPQTNATRNATDGLNIAYWAEAAAPEFGTILGPTTLAVTIITIDNNQVLQDVDIAFNGRDFTWTIAGGATQDDIQSIAAHEIGHGIGFHHSEVAGATMTAFYGGGTAPRSLEADDVAAINWRYPPVVTDLTPEYYLLFNQ